MAKGEKGSGEGRPERFARLYRNWNVLGAVALGGAAVIAPPVLATVLGAAAGLNAVQAGGGELARRWAEKKRRKKK